MYQCAKCNSKQKADISMKFESLPEILNLQLHRYLSFPLLCSVPSFF